ncbi:ABC protein [Mycena sanguinolenta]|uniref:ABC protein n=1 Tax=Mycena sanguinolenta TaxID=230812 RepID=A0A8H6XHZ1_9AGAR|nr:ABC protein [Mycena sanguinolenta]
MDFRCPNCGDVYSGPLAPEPTTHLSVTRGTRHHTLLNTNEPPEDSELTFIHSVVSKTCIRLKHLDDEISKIQERLKQLEDERAALSSFRTRNKAILSPLRRMPPEVLSEIFSWTLLSVHDLVGITSFDMAESPWFLTQISSRWRAVSLSTPSLWSRVVIDHRSANAPALALAETQVHRAQKLHIHFYGSPEADSEPQIQMFELLLKHSSRWEDLSIGITPEMLPLLTALRDGIPSLKRVWIQWHDVDSSAVQSLDCFQTAPSLVDFGVYHEHHFISIAVPIQQLTRYHLNGPWQTHLTILKLAENLVEAHISVRFDYEFGADKTEIITLPRLRRVCVSHVEALDYLKAPTLEGLAIWASDIVHHVESFLGRSECPLRSLCLRGSDAQTTAQILGKFTSITELALTVDQFDSQAEIDSLMSTLTSSKLAPQLRSFFFGSEDRRMDDHTLFLKMLRTRWETDGSALKDVALLLGMDFEPDADTLGLLHALRLEGLNLRIQGGPMASKEIHSWFYSYSWIF